jgi:hypothetical protein
MTKDKMNRRRLIIIKMIGAVFVCSVFCLIFPPLSLGEGQSGKTMVQVELDIYSGRPNPRWVLNAQEHSTLIQQLGRLLPTQTGEPRLNLGYRGLIVTALEGDMAGFQEIVCSGGLVLGDSTQKFSDPDRSLERWLLQTGRAHLDLGIRDLIEQDWQGF